MMQEYIVTGVVRLMCNITLEAQNEHDAKREALGWFENGANIESDAFSNMEVVNAEVSDVNEE
tara:strand:+ start:1920 stop:2108 length:189 start_codon:yes stop_codon:yes gene_type:complete